MNKKVTEIRSHIPASKVHSFVWDTKTTEQTLNKLGIGYEKSALKEMQSFYGMDAAVAGITTPTVTTPIQFLQHWLPNVVEVVTAAKEIDAIAGRTMAGNWYDEEIVMQVLERTGQAVPYGDHTNIPLSSWNLNYETRDIVRFEEGIQVGVLEEMRAGAMNISSQTRKREAAAESLAIELNNIGFFGYNEGNNKTYGFLNDPNLPAYTTVATNGAGTPSTKWKDKTYAQITNDLRTAFAALRTQSGNLFKPERDAAKLVIAVNCMEYLNVENEFGKSVYDFLKQNYPNVTIESAVQLDGANGGANVFYLFAESINGNPVLNQYVQDVFRLVGTEKRAKVFVEDYSNASAGILVSQPVGIVRYSGI
jgi:hypothetical protein